MQSSWGSRRRRAAWYLHHCRGHIFSPGRSNKHSGPSSLVSTSVHGTMGSLLGSSRALRRRTCTPRRWHQGSTRHRHGAASSPGPQPSPKVPALVLPSPSTRSLQKWCRASTSERSCSQQPRAGHKDAEAFLRAGAGQWDLAGDETGGQYNSPFVLPAPSPPALPHAIVRLVFRN